MYSFFFQELYKSLLQAVHAEHTLFDNQIGTIKHHPTLKSFQRFRNAYSQSDFDLNIQWKISFLSHLAQIKPRIKQEKSSSV